MGRSDFRPRAIRKRLEIAPWKFYHVITSWITPHKQKMVTGGCVGAAAHIGEVDIQNNSPFLYSSSNLQVATDVAESRPMAQNACSGPRMCLLGVWLIVNHFWGHRVGKTQKFWPEIGISHVKQKTLITRKPSQIAQNGQQISILNRGRSFRIRHFYLSVAPPSGRNRDFSISGFLKSPMVRKRC